MPLWTNSAESPSETFRTCHDSEPTLDSTEVSAGNVTLMFLLREKLSQPTLYLENTFITETDFCSFSCSWPNMDSSVLSQDHKSKFKLVSVWMWTSRDGLKYVLVTSCESLRSALFISYQHKQDKHQTLERRFKSEYKLFQCNNNTNITNQVFL